MPKEVMKMSRKIISIAIMIVMCVSANFFGHIVYGAGGGTTEGATGGLQLPIENPSYYKPGSQDTATGADKVKDIGNTIIGLLQILGSIISVAVLVILGIKYMIGSVEERAEYKKAMTPYIIGAIMVFAITNLLGIIVEIAKKI